MTLDDYTIELGDDSGLAISKSVYDIIEPDKRSSGFTKTITIPSSQQNDRIFADMFDVNFHLSSDTQWDSYFNPSKKAPCFIHTEDEEQITGYAQLTDIVITNEKIEYKVTVYGEVANIFSSLRDAKLSDLDLSRYNHAYTKTNIENSWSNDIYISGVLTASENGTGYVYPMVDYGDNHLKTITLNFWLDYWEVTHFRPWVFVKTIIDSIFAQAGFKYSSTFFNSDLFKKLIYQGDVNGLSLTDDEVEELSINASRQSSEQSYTLAMSVGSANLVITDAATAYTTRNIIFNNETLDDAGQYETASGTTTINSTTRYNLTYNIDVRVDCPSGTLSVDYAEITLKFAGVKSDGSIFFAFQYQLALQTFTIGDQYDITISHREELPINDNDEYRLVFLGYESNQVAATGNVSGDFRVNIKTGSSYAMTPVAYLPVGSTVNLSNMLTGDMTQKDFLMGIIKMFNLYVEPYNYSPDDPDSGGYVTYLIESRDDYYTDTVIDWTSKLDISRPFTIKPVALAKYKYYNFTYAEDNDLMNDRYKGQTGRVYGDYLHFIDNDFATETKDIKIPFSQCIISDQSNKNHWTQREIPVNKTISGEPRMDGKPKILFWQGLATGESWNFEGVEQTQVPFSGQLDDRTTPVCDLSFKIPKVIYYSGDANGEVTLTSGTLFNRYHYRAIREINDRNSKLIECYMRLYPSDVHNLSFRPLYFIDNAYYRLYEVLDHKYDDTTLCRFLKITDVTGVTGAVYKSKGGRGVFGQLDDDLPTKAPLETGGARTGDVTTGVSGGVVGTGTTDGGFTRGKLGSNILQAGTAKSVIYGDDIIDLGYQYKNIASGSTTLTGSEGSPLYVFADTSAGDTLLYLPDYEEHNGKVVFTTKTHASNQLYIYDHNDVLIDTISGMSEGNQMLLTLDGVKIVR